MITGLENHDVSAIRAALINLKNGVMTVVDMGDKAFKSDDPKKCPAFTTFQMNCGMIAVFEAEIYRRGMDPHHPTFGRNISDIVDYFMERWG